MSFLLMTLSTYFPSLLSLANEKLYADCDYCVQLIIGEGTTQIICINHMPNSIAFSLSNKQ